MGEVGGGLSRRSAWWPLPATLRELDVNGELSMKSMALFSNLTSLARLRLVNCKALRTDGFNPLIAANLKKLVVYNYNMKCGEGVPDSIGADLLLHVARTKLIPAGSIQLEVLRVDNISGVLVAPICNLLAAKLRELAFEHDARAERFTEEQESALQLLTSLQNLQFRYCNRLQCIPQGLGPLSSLRDLQVLHCPEMQPLPLVELKRSNPDLIAHY